MVKNSNILWLEKKNYSNAIEPLGKLVFTVCIDGFNVLKHRNKCLYTVQNTWHCRIICWKQEEIQIC